jgi:hypothetical protein
MAGKHISLLVHFTWSTAGREPWLKKDAATLIAASRLLLVNFS